MKGNKKEKLGKKPSTTKSEPPIYTGKLSKPPDVTQLSPYRSINTKLLSTLRSSKDATTAIELLIEETGDLSQALYNFIRLSNVGHEMAIYSLDKKTRLEAIELEWRGFASRVNAMSNAGLDGLIDQFHYLAFVRGGMACEVEVESDLSDIVEVYPINPQTLTWKFEGKDGRFAWVPYQLTMKGDISLGKANFLWVPTDPKVDDPRGRLLLKPAILAIDFQTQVLTDLQQVIHNQGWPRYDISIDLEKLMAIAPPDIKADQDKTRKWIETHINAMKTQFEQLMPDDSFIHTTSETVELKEGAMNSRGIDIRAVMEMVDIQIMNAAKTPGTMMQRINSQTETWSTVQFRIFVSGIQSIQRGSKRLIENICALWLRVKGYQGVPVFTHNLIDYESEKQRNEIKQVKANFFKLCQEMGWIEGDEAAQELFGHNAVQEGGGDGDGDTKPGGSKKTKKES